jgi:cytochrome c-type biogenesis protein CcmH/NrfG
MSDKLAAGSNGSASLNPKQVYALAVLCLLVGLAAGCLLRGSSTPVAPAPTVALVAPPLAPGDNSGSRRVTSPKETMQTADQRARPLATGTPSVGSVRARNGEHMPSQEELKQMADKQAAPLVEKLKSNPNDSVLLTQIGGIYHTTHLFKEAASYYGQALQVDPKNVAIRTKLASSLYRAGDVDGAIVQLDRALSYDPKDANSLFDLGIIRLEGKQDGKGALDAWQRLLKSNPHLSAERKATVQGLMANVLTTLANEDRSSRQ